MSKKIIVFLLSLSLIFSLGFTTSTTYAEEGKITVTVTEKIPGAGCTENPKQSTEDKTKDKKVYTCTIEKGFGTVVTTMGKIIKYFTFIAALGGVLALVIGGIMYSMGGANDEMKTKSKEFITKVIFGLVLLLFSGVILNAIAPWVYK